MAEVTRWDRETAARLLYPNTYRDVLALAQALADAREAGRREGAEPFEKLAEWMSGPGAPVDYTHGISESWFAEIDSPRWDDLMGSGTSPTEAARDLCIKLGLMEAQDGE